MSHNNKNARQHREAKARSEQRVKERASGVEKKPQGQGRATNPKHGKKKAWWQRGITYAQFIKGGAKPARGNEASSGD